MVGASSVGTAGEISSKIELDGGLDGRCRTRRTTRMDRFDNL